MLNSVQDSSKDLKKILGRTKARRKNQFQINSAQNRESQLHRLYRCLGTGATEGHRLHRCLSFGLTGLCNGGQVKKSQCHRLHRCSMIKQRSIHGTILQRAYCGDKTFSSAPVTPMASTRSTGLITIVFFREGVMLSSGFSSAPATPVLHRSKHRCNDVSLSAVSEVQRLLFGFSVTG